MINIEDFDSNLLKMNIKWYKNMGITLDTSQLKELMIVKIFIVEILRGCMFLSRQVHVSE